MAKKEWKRVEGIGNNGDVYIEADDIREIKAIQPPTVAVDENGEEHPRSAVIVVEGPKGGELRISLPKQYWDDIQADVASGLLKPGMGVDCIGWKRLFDKNGKPVLDAQGRQRKTFYPNGARPNFYC